MMSMLCSISFMAIPCNRLLSALMKHKSLCDVQTKEREEVGEDNALIVTEKIENVRPLLSEATGKVVSMPLASAEECSMDSSVEGVGGGEPTVASAEECSMEPSADVSHGNVCNNTSTDMCDDNGALCDSLDLGNVSKGDDKSKLVEESIASYFKNLRCCWTADKMLLLQTFVALCCQDSRLTRI